MAWGTSGFSTSQSPVIEQSTDNGGNWSAASYLSPDSLLVVQQSDYFSFCPPQLDQAAFLSIHSADIRNTLDSSEFSQFYMKLPQSTKSFWQETFGESPKMWSALSIKSIDNIDPDEGVYAFTSDKTLYLNSAVFNNSSLASIIYVYEKAIAQKGYTNEQAMLLAEKYAQWEIKSAGDDKLAGELKANYEEMISVDLPGALKQTIVDAFFDREIILDNAYSYLSVDQAAGWMFTGTASSGGEDNGEKAAYLCGLSDTDLVSLFALLPDTAQAYSNAYSLLAVVAGQEGGEVKAAAWLADLPAQKTASILAAKPASSLILEHPGLVLDSFGDETKAAAYFSSIYNASPAAAVDITLDMISRGETAEITGILNTMQPSEAAAVLGSAGKDAAAKVLPGLSPEQAQMVIVALDAQVRSAALQSIAGKEETLEIAVDWFAGLENEAAAQILGSVDPSVGGKVLPLLDKDKAIGILQTLDSGPRSDILSSAVSDGSALPVVTDWFLTLGTEESAAMIGRTGADTGIKVLTAMDPGQAVKIFSGMDAGTAASILTEMSADAGDLAVATGWLKQISVDTTAGILDLAGADTAARVLTALDNPKAAEMLGKLDVKVSSAVVAQMSGNADSFTAVTGWMKQMKSAAAAGILNAVPAGTAVTILGQFDSAKAAGVLSELAPDISAGIITQMSGDAESLAVAAGWLKQISGDKTAGILNTAGIVTASKVLTSFDNVKAAEILGKLDLEVGPGLLEEMQNSETGFTAAAGWLNAMEMNKAAAVLNEVSDRSAANFVSGLDGSKAVNIMLLLPEEKRSCVITLMLSDPDKSAVVGGWLAKADKTKAVELLFDIVTVDRDRSIPAGSGGSTALKLFSLIPDAKRQNELLKAIKDKANGVKNSLSSEQDQVKKDSSRKILDNYDGFIQEWEEVRNGYFLQFASREGNSYSLTADKAAKTSGVFTQTSELWRAFFNEDFGWDTESITVKGVDSKVLAGTVFENTACVFDSGSNTLYVKDGVPTMSAIWNEREKHLAADDAQGAEFRKTALMLITDMGIDRQKLLEANNADPEDIQSVLRGITGIGYPAFKEALQKTGLSAAVGALILNNPGYLSASLEDVASKGDVISGLLYTVVGAPPAGSADTAWSSFSRLDSATQSEVFNGLLEFYYADKGALSGVDVKAEYDRSGLSNRTTGLEKFMKKAQNPAQVLRYLSGRDEGQSVKAVNLLAPGIGKAVIQGLAKNYSSDSGEQLKRTAELLKALEPEAGAAILQTFDAATMDKVVSLLTAKEAASIMDGYSKVSVSSAVTYFSRINPLSGIAIMAGMDKENVKRLFSSFSDKTAAGYVEAMLAEDQESNLVDVFNGENDPKILDGSGNAVGTMRKAVLVKTEDKLPSGILLPDGGFYSIDYDSLSVSASASAEVKGKSTQISFNVIQSGAGGLLRCTAEDKRAFQVYKELLPYKDRFYDSNFKEIVKNRIMDAPDGRRLAILVFAQYDYNGAMSSKDAIISSLINNGYRVMYYTAKTDTEAINSVLTAAHLYLPQEQRADFIWFSAHGDLQSMRWGTSSYFSAADYNAMQKMEYSLASGGTVVVSSCSAAIRLRADDGNLYESMAEMIADAFWSTAGYVFATDNESISLNRLEFSNGKVIGAVWNLLDNCDSNGENCRTIGNSYNWDVSVRHSPTRLPY